MVWARTEHEADNQMNSRNEEETYFLSRESTGRSGRLAGAGGGSGLLSRVLLLKNTSSILHFRLNNFVHML